MIALVANAHTVGTPSGANGVTTPAIDTTGANFIALSVAFDALVGTPTISDSKSNTYTNLATHSASAGTTSVLLAYCASPTVGTGHTFTIAGTGTLSNVAAAAFSGVLASSPADGAAQNGAGTSPTGTTIQTGAITPSQNNELVISALGFNSVLATISIDSSMAITDTADGITAVTRGVSLAYIVQTTAAQINPTWTSSGNVAAAATIAGFKAIGLPTYTVSPSSASGTVGQQGPTFTSTASAAWNTSGQGNTITVTSSDALATVVLVSGATVIGGQHQATTFQPTNSSTAVLWAVVGGSAGASTLVYTNNYGGADPVPGTYTGVVAGGGSRGGSIDMDLSLNL